jgi:hypothetical protein
MEFKTEGGVMLNLKVLDYEFPEKIIDSIKDKEANLLIIYFRLVCGHRRDGSNLDRIYRGLSKSMTTWELSKLSDWFDMLSKNLEPAVKGIEENDLIFSFILRNDHKSEIKTIKLYFNKYKSSLDLELSNLELKRISEELKDDLAKYPIR